MADKTITDFKKSVAVIASVVATASGAAAAELAKLFARPFSPRARSSPTGSSTRS